MKGPFILYPILGNLEHLFNHTLKSCVVILMNMILVVLVAVLGLVYECCYSIESSKLCSYNIGSSI